MDSTIIASAALTVTVAGRGAELTSVRHVTAGEVLWQAGAIWPSHAPVLFPIVGQLAEDRLWVDGVAYPMGRHGFARRSTFEMTQAVAAACRFELRDSDATRAMYPFAFEFEVGYAVAGETLTMTMTVRNTGDVMLPASCGAHPAFAWPLGTAPKTAHTIVFAQDEPAPIRRLHHGLLGTDEHPTPIVGNTLALDDALFVDDALVMDRIRSTSVRYGAPSGPALEVAWDGFRELGIWTKPGADFICIEPWHGYASPVGFDGPFTEKPGLMHIAPGESRTLTLHVTVHA